MLKSSEGFQFSSQKELKNQESKEKICKYCGAESGHWGTCLILSGNFGLEKEKENYTVETIRYSGDKIVEHVKKYDKDFNGYIIDKIEFIDNKNNIVDISKFIPIDTKLIRDELGYQKITNHFIFDSDRNFISYCNLKEKGRIFSLLHEIGHAVDNKKEKIKRLNYSALRHSFFFQKKLLKGAKNIANWERRAWAYALNIVRQFKKKDIIIEPQLDYSEYIKSALHSHYDILKYIKGGDFNEDMRRKFKKLKNIDV